MNKLQDSEYKLIDDYKGKVPEARAFHSSVLIKNNFICSYGGIMQNTILNELLIYDIIKNEFSTVKNDKSKFYINLVPLLYSHSCSISKNKYKT